MQHTTVIDGGTAEDASNARVSMQGYDAINTMQYVTWGSLNSGDSY